ncbi:MAG: hypothetical protein QOJ26_1688 [Thermoplasmata archaeon]|jgi:uncharacterized membrane protein|nr:hypothetical protein [Thermoplasmata archaeon]
MMDPAPPPHRQRLRQRLKQMRSKGLEKIMLFGGGLLLFGVLAEITAVTFLRPSMGIALWRELAVEVTVGREASFPIALQGGVPPLVLAQVSFTQDIGLFCVVFPLFLRLMQRYQDSPSWLMRRLQRIQAAGEKHRQFARRWGPWGVFVFMLVPFLVNGPLVGGVMGRLAGIPTRSLLLPVIASTIVAAFAWSYAYDAMLGIVGELHPALPALLTATVVGALLSWLLLDEWILARRMARAPR